MNDKLSASWVLVVGTVFIAYYYWRIKPGVKGPGITATVDDAASKQAIGASPKGSILEQILAIGKQFGLKTPTLGQTTGGKHVAGSLHYQGRAADFSISGISDDVLAAFTAAERAAGFQVHEEYAGSTPYSTGHHLHVSKPFPGGGW